MSKNQEFSQNSRENAKNLQIPANPLTLVARKMSKRQAWYSCYNKISRILRFGHLLFSSNSRGVWNVTEGFKIQFFQIQKSLNFCYWNFKSWYNKVSRFLRFGHLLFSSFCCPLCENKFENSILSNQKILELLLLKL